MGNEAGEEFAQQRHGNGLQREALIPKHTIIATSNHLGERDQSG